MNPTPRFLRGFGSTLTLAGVLVTQTPTRDLKPGLWELTASVDRTWTATLRGCLISAKLSPSQLSLALPGLTCAQNVTKDTRTTIEVTSTCQPRDQASDVSSRRLTGKLHLEKRSPTSLSGTITAAGGNLYRTLDTTVTGRWVDQECDVSKAPGLANIGAIVLSGIPFALNEALQGGEAASDFGAGAIREGNGCVSPTLTRRIDPAYTSEAMKGKVQGDVEFEAVIQKDGTVGALRVIKALGAC